MTALGPQPSKLGENGSIAESTGVGRHVLRDPDDAIVL